MLNKAAAILLWPIYWLVFPLRLRASAVIIVNDEVLVVKHWLGYGNWNLPGGGVKYNEPPKDAVIREVKEELGLEVDNVNVSDLSPSFDVVRENGIISRHKFYLIKLSKKPSVVPNREITEYEWASTHSISLGADARQAVDKL